MINLENNKINTIDEVTQLKSLKELNYLDLTQNPVTSMEGYREKIFEALPNLYALDGYDKDGGSVMLDDDNDYDEEGEFEDFEEKLKLLDPELRKKYEDGNMDVDEMRALGLLPDFIDGLEFEEGGEDELDENGAELAEGELGKRERDGEADKEAEKDGKKEQKKEE